MVAEALGRLVRGAARSPWDVRQTLRWLTPAWICLAASLALSLLGIHCVDVAAGGDGPLGLGRTAIKQVIFVGVGIAAAAIIALPHYRWLLYLAVPWLIAMVGMLVFLLLPFVPDAWVTRNGTRGWFKFGWADFQPAEIAKIAYVLVIARYLRFRKEHRRFLGLVPVAVITFIPVGLITLQPDLGTAMLFVPSLFAMLLAAGARLRHLSIIVLAAMLAGPAAYPLLKPHQKARIVGLIKQVQGDRTSAHDLNFQAFTAQTIAGAGELTGMSAQHATALIRYNALPEGHNDMVYSVVLCRFGALGGLVVMGLYVAWIAGALGAAAMCRDAFGRLVAVGIAAFVAAQAAVNIGMNLGVLPIIGITLPFVSYGGSSVLSCWLMTGLVMSVGLHRPIGPYRRSFEYDDDED